VGINAPPKRDVTAFVNPSLDQVVHGDAVVRLKALDAIRRHFRDTSQDDVRVAVLANWDDADRNVRLACVPLIDRLGRDHVSLLEASARQPLAAATLALGCVQSNPQLSVRTACDVISAPTSLNAARLDAVRAIQLVLGDIGSPRLSGTIWEGYTARAPLGGPDSGTVRPELAALIRSTFAKSFPSGDPSVDRELARVLAMLEDGNRTTLSKILRFITADSSPEDDIHYLAVLARLRAPRTEQATLLVAQALLALDRKCEQQKKNRDRNWLLRVGELYSELASKDSELNERLLSDSDFGRPDHVVFVRGDGTSRVWAASRFIARSKTDPEFAWSARLVELVGELPGDDAAPVLRDLWQNVALRDSILRVLARQADLVDRDKFIAGLESGQIDTVANCLSALERLPEPDDPNELLELVRTTRRLSDGNEEIRLRERVGKLLQARTGETIAPGDTGAWTEWLEGRYPKLAVRLSGNDAVDPGTWRRRLGEINWSTGSAAQGRFVFSRAGCLACHSGPRAIGPDLRGVASRFSIGDLFQAIVQPSRDVSPRYQTTRVATADGRAHQGVIIYEAVDSLILQTAADATVRINASQIVERRVTTSSIMPAGLIDELTDSQIADLYAYLKSAM
jgi:putative heme-binding domain-containing protein